MNWLDLLIAVIVGVGLIKGLFDGLIKQVVSVVSFILAIFFAGKTAKPLCDFLVSFEPVTNIVSPQVITVICYILAFVLIIVIFRWLGRLLDKAIESPVSCLNHALGGILGAFLSLLLSSLVLNVLTIVDSDSKVIKEHTKNESALFYKVEGIVTFISPFIKEAHKIKKDSRPTSRIPDKTAEKHIAKFLQSGLINHFTHDKYKKKEPIIYKI